MIRPMSTNARAVISTIVMGFLPLARLPVSEQSHRRGYDRGEVLNSTMFMLSAYPLRHKKTPAIETGVCACSLSLWTAIVGG